MRIPYIEAKGLIKEADVLLFKSGAFPSVGWWIGKYTHSIYSHVGLAHWCDNELYCVEFREFKGSRRYPMDKYVQEANTHIDVFRAVDTAVFPRAAWDSVYYTTYQEKKFTADIANRITHTALELLGEKYSYWTIWQMVKTYVPLVRLRTKVIKNGEADPKQFVCSTLVTYTYRKHFIDPVPFLSDGQTSPGDLARSGLFSYLFSIK